MHSLGLRHAGIAMCLIGIVLCMWSDRLNAQIDSVLQLEQIEVTAQRLNLSEIGKHSELIDSQKLTMRSYNNLSEVLAFQTPLFVRSYGLGTLATLGIRGASAVHTQFVWNGIPLRNPMLGLLDIALIPSFFTDEVAIHYGGHGAAFGSGAIGGLVSLTNKPISASNRMDVHLSAGSWGSYLGEVKFDYGSKKLRFSTRLFYQEAENNFRYKLSKDSPEKNQVHHQLQNLGLLQEVSWAMNQKERLTGRLWLQYTDRQIPPTSTQKYSEAAQQDESVRASIQWDRDGDKVDWQIRTALLDENIEYQDSQILLYTTNQFRTWITEAQATFWLSPGFTLTSGVFTQQVEAKSANYKDGTNREQYGGFASLRYLLDDWVFRFQMREEVTNGQWSPLLLDISTEWMGLRNFTFKSSLSRNYRIPTLNDYYWSPGGNQELSPEQGWTFETGVHYHLEGRKWALKASATGYVRSIKDWIMWLPPLGTGRNYWTPVNVVEVNSAGTELRTGLSFTDNKWVASLDIGMDLTWSQFGNDLPEFMIERGDQVFYVPIQNAFVGLSVGRKKWSCYYYHHWFGASNGISESVDPGTIGSAGLNYGPASENKLWSVYLQADNLWNVPYRRIERRPMPGRSFKFGLRFTII